MKTKKLSFAVIAMAIVVIPNILPITLGIMETLLLLSIHARHILTITQTTHGTVLP